MPRDNRDDVVRLFFATLLGVEIQKDGQVPGFKEWDRTTHGFANQEAFRVAEWCAIKVRRDGRDPDECVGAGLRYYRTQLRSYTPPEPEIPDPEYTRFRFSIIDRILSDGMTPVEVAKALEQSADRFPQITYEECLKYREMDDVWRPWDGEPLPPETVAAVRARKKQGRQTPILSQIHSSPRPRVSDEMFFEGREKPLETP